GNKETVAYLQAEAEANWIHQNEPAIWEKTHKYLFLSGYLIYRLTDRFVDSVGAQVGYVPFDYRRHRWAPSWDWKWKVLPLTPSLLPDLVAPSGELGRITKRAAAETGIPAGTPLIAAAADKACEVLGSGCLHPTVACLSYGTTATINTTHRTYLEAIPMLPPYPAAVPGAYSLEIMIYRGFWMVSWFRDQFAHRERERAAAMGIEAEHCLEELIGQSPPGAHGLILQPYWSPGLKFPGPEARGAIVGFGDVHNRVHVYRAILEGLAYALREGKERQERRSGVPTVELRVAGGGSQSDGALQLTADIFGLPVGRPHIYETSALGAAMDAAVGLGIYGSFDEAVRQMTRVSRYFEPDPQNHRIYDVLYRKVYRRLYNRLRPLYAEIRRIMA
ncbi:MAG: FGGY-family carbohydrate kinase, partial [Syntrophales bacterium]|nr:FGGY-family carbohydrate kinase [Syntrophales bacterium]